MDPAYLNPIMPILPDVGWALVVPFLLAVLGAGLGIGAVLVLVLRDDGAGRRRGAILDVRAPGVLEAGDRPARRRFGRRSFVQSVKEVVDALPVIDS
jgi:hypothetical protein